ncbi:amino acid ABC transporter substrate-binding protein [Duganella sp. LX20W]|uniref:Amino acid ABC transporter substrate-binding protein n=1 Tax=Rugamonas brunnea TaxID=2758569 RepID=A0A7W2ERV7_9BURK|nr:amino acid ABC transporter substrate-binding protein [Rugamonas brunnea]MBA5637473.1 amino acid ABC transporter substrate-binding protein [Rugamonas brunnea]
MRSNKVLVAAALLGVMAGAVAGEAGGPLKLAKPGTITIGYRDASQPFSFADAQHKPAGYTIDLCGAVVEAIRKELGQPELKVSYVPVSSSDRIAKVKDGAVDLECGSTSITPQRATEVAFSTPIFFSDTKVMVRADSGIQSVADLKDKRVIVNQGASGAPVLAKADLEKGLHIQFVKSHDNVESFGALQQKKVDAFVHDDVQLAQLAATASNPKGFVLLKESLASDPIAIMLRKDNKPLQQLVDATLAKLSASGEFSKIYSKWFLTPTFKFPMSENLKHELKNPGK